MNLSRKEAIRRALHEAFENVTNPFGEERTISHGDYVWMRSRLSLLTPDDLHYILPQLLENLLDVVEPNATEDIDFVISFLNVPSEVSNVDKDRLAASFGAEVTERFEVNSRLLASEKAKSFSKFSRVQAGAIASWLRYVSTYSELEDNPDLPSAIIYWTKRASAPR